MNVKKIVSSSTCSNADVSQRAVKSGVWIFILRAVQQVFTFVRTLILAHILAPHDFGLMGVALLVISTLDTFSQPGLQQALIQKKCEIKSYLDSVWTVVILRSFIIFAILYEIAPYTAVFFNAPEAKPIIQVIGLSVILQAFTNIGVIYFQKELEFNKQFIYQLSGTLIDFAVAIIAILILRNVWAMVFGLLAGNAAMLITSYLIHPYRPRLRFDFVQVKELFGYGKWIFGSNVLVFVITQWDNVFVGRFLGLTALGFYQMAYQISNLPATEITHLISQVTFPFYSKIQDDIPKLREAYLKVLQCTTFLSFLITGLIFILIPDFTIIFLGDKWMPITSVIQVLVFSGLVRSIAATTGPIFYSVGKPKIDTKWQIVRLSVLAILIYPFSIKWGILGTSIAVFLSTFVSAIGFLFDVIKVIKCNVKNIAKTLFIPTVKLIIMIFLIFALKSYCNVIDILHFISYAGACILIYMCMSHLLEKSFEHIIRYFIKESLSFPFGNQKS